MIIYFEKNFENGDVLFEIIVISVFPETVIAIVMGYGQFLWS